MVVQETKLKGSIKMRLLHTMYVRTYKFPCMYVDKYDERKLHNSTADNIATA